MSWVGFTCNRHLTILNHIIGLLIPDVIHQQEAASLSLHCKRFKKKKKIKTLNPVFKSLSVRRETIQCRDCRRRHQDSHLWLHLTASSDHGNRSHSFTWRERVTTIRRAWFLDLETNRDDRSIEVSNLTRRRETRRAIPAGVRRRDDRTVRATGGSVLGLGACATAYGGEEMVKRCRLRLCIICIRALRAPSRIRHSATTSALLYSLKTASSTTPYCNRAV